MPNFLYRNLTDEDLLMHVANKQDQEAFNMLYRRYAHLAYGICLKYLRDGDSAQDAVQQVFTKLWTDSLTNEVYNFKAWFYKVVRNYCLMQLRKNNPHLTLEENVLAGFMESDDQSHRKIKEEQLLTMLEDCIKKLNDYQQVCVKYFYLQQKTYAQTAELLDFTEKEVKTHLQNGRRNLKNCVGSKWINYS